MDSHLKILSNAVSSYGDYVIVFNENKEVVYSNNIFSNEFESPVYGVDFDSLYRKLDKKSKEIYSFVSFLKEISSKVLDGNVFDELYEGNDGREYAVHCHCFNIEHKVFAICWRVDLSVSFRKYGLCISDPLQDPITKLFNHRIIKSINIERGSLICVSIDKIKSLYKKEGKEYLEKIKKNVSLLLTDVCHEAICVYLNGGVFVAILEIRKKESYKTALKIKKKLFLLSKNENYIVDFHVDVKSFTNDNLIPLLDKLKK